MLTTPDINAIVATTTNLRWLRVAPVTVLLATLNTQLPQLLPAEDGATHCGIAFEPNGVYPPLSGVQSPDLSGEPGVLIHLQRERGVVELEDCLYEVDRPLEVDFTLLSQIELLFDLPGAELGARVFVSDATGLVQNLDVFGGSFTYTMTADDVLGFEVAPLVQEAPTVPVVVTRPREEDPDPD